MAGRQRQAGRAAATHCWSPRRKLLDECINLRIAASIDVGRGKEFARSIPHVARREGEWRRRCGKQVQSGRMEVRFYTEQNKNGTGQSKKLDRTEQNRR